MKRPLVFCSLYGISDEWYQSFLLGRDADYLAWIADTVEASIALITIYFWKSTTENLKDI
ncbi:MAG: VanZ family protein [Methylococcales symbiont of Hymedesmia sp. n. MRB-2018]|nr:MAG: VanZ family protein [Methylococcales symbiont of Hymedesmia sp. n. MRB-2018]